MSWMKIKDQGEKKISGFEGRHRAVLPLDNNIIQKENSEFSLSIRPMLAGHADAPFDNKDWVFEVKWDGVRAIFLQNKNKRITEIQSRNGKNITHRYPEITKAINSVLKNNESVVWMAR